MSGGAFDLDRIKAFWTAQAIEHGQSHAASWSDLRVIEMEIREILKHLRDGDRVLDVGCANGFSTVQFATQRDITIRGLDYIPQMIGEARSRQANLPSPLRERIEFEVGDIAGMDEPDERYDAVVVIRVLINLHDWEHQALALRECCRVVKPGGVLLLSEATVQGWRRLNLFRAEWNLPNIPVPPFNRYLDQEQVAAAIPPEMVVEEISDFASSYYVATRVFKPLLARHLGGGIDAADPGMEWNRFFSALPPAGDYGTQKLFVIRKR